MADTRGLKPIAWMRRWAYDKIDVMALLKAKRPRGWNFHATTVGQLFDDDVPLVAAAEIARLEPEPDMMDADGWGIDEREDDAIIFCTNWQGGRTALARRPKLMTNAAWRPIAEDIIVALAAARSLTGAKP